MTVNAKGYAGDGLASLSDEFIANTLIGSKAGSITTAGDITITLDPAFIEALLNNYTHLGLRLESATTGPFVNIAAIEHPTGFEPTLTITYELPDPAAQGDFNGDGIVNAADYVVWRKTGGTQQQYANWRSNYGKTLGTGLSLISKSSPAAAVPEPATALPLILGSIAGSLRRKT
jgi:hypothetical protein